MRCLILVLDLDLDLSFGLEGLEEEEPMLVVSGLVGWWVGLCRDV